jgi:replication-associated recombination protein RarA
MSNLAPEMAKDPAKKRIEIHVLPELKEALIQLAKADKRSLLNYIEVVMEKHVKEQNKKKKDR